MSRTTEPTTITQGERIEWSRSLCDYPASIWTLKYFYRGPGTGKDVTATADGDDHNVVLTANAPTTFNVAGKYSWQAWITEIADSSNTFIVDEGTIEVRQGFAAGETGDVDLRSDAKIMLDAIDAALLAFSESDVLEYEISTPAGSRRVKRSDKAELMSQRKYWAGIVSHENTAERLRTGGKFGKPIKVSMSSQ